MRRLFTPAGQIRGVLNDQLHDKALYVFVVVVLAHWVEHLSQGVQIYVLGWPRSEALGVLGLFYPWLAASEWLHYGYNAALLFGLWLLLPGFAGRARPWWRLALAIQVWHHFEHLLLVWQASTGVHLFGSAVPTSIAQLVVPRVELHLLYNAIVTVPLLAGFWLCRPWHKARARSRASITSPRPVAELQPVDS